MTGRVKNLREITALIESEGFRIISLDQGKHVKMTVEMGGCRRMIVATTSATDHRARLNLRGQVRRMAREMGA